MPVRLLGEDLSPDAAEFGLAEGSIQAAVESRLRSARLHDSGSDLSLCSEELCQQSERFHGEDTAWRIQLDKVASHLVYKDGLAGSGPTPHHPGN